jgi:hypothetical protein
MLTPISVTAERDMCHSKSGDADGYCEYPKAERREKFGVFSFGQLNFSC